MDFFSDVEDELKYQKGKIASTWHTVKRKLTHNVLPAKQIATNGMQRKATYSSSNDPETDPSFYDELKMLFHEIKEQVTSRSKILGKGRKGLPKGESTQDGDQFSADQIIHSQNLDENNNHCSLPHDAQTVNQNEDPYISIIKTNDNITITAPCYLPDKKKKLAAMARYIDNELSSDEELAPRSPTFNINVKSEMNTYNACFFPPSPPNKGKHNIELNTAGNNIEVMLPETRKDNEKKGKNHSRCKIM